MDEAGSPLELSPPNVLGAPTPKRTPQTQTLLPFKNPSCSWVPPRTLNNLESGKEQEGKTDPSGGSRRGAPGLEDRHNCRFYPQTNRSPWRDKPSSDGPKKTRRRVLTRCKAGCRPPPATPVPQTGGCSSEPQGGCHAAPAPPPRLDLGRLTHGLRTESMRSRTSRLHAEDSSRTRPCFSGWAPPNEGRSTASRGVAREAKRTNQDSQILRRPALCPAAASLPPSGRRTLVYSKPRGV